MEPFDMMASIAGVLQLLKEVDSWIRFSQEVIRKRIQKEVHYLSIHLWSANQTRFVTKQQLVSRLYFVFYTRS
jgi:hypothetical protein